MPRRLALLGITIATSIVTATFAFHDNRPQCFHSRFNTRNQKFNVTKRHRPFPLAVTTYNMSFSGRIQTSLLHTFWSLATRLGLRQLGDWLKRWYPSAYGDTIFYVQESNTEQSHPPLTMIGLTIDDGLFRSDQGGSPMIQQVCDLLQRYQAHATFFVCTNYITTTQVEQILQSNGNHEFGNHLKEDRSGYYYRLDVTEFGKELDESNTTLQQAIMAATGKDNDNDSTATTIKWFRAPQGVMSPAMCQVLRDRQIINVLGDCYCDDWAFAEKLGSTKQLVAPLMLKQVQPGSIAIFHMPQRGFRETTFYALEEFLEGLKERNLRCVTLSELMEHQHQQQNAP